MDDSLAVGDGLLVALPVCGGVPRAVTATLTVWLSVVVTDGLADSLSVAVCDDDGELLLVHVGNGVTVPLALPLGVRDGVTLGVLVSVPLAVMLAVTLPDCVTLTLTVLLGVPLAEMLAEAVAVGVTELLED